MNRMKIYLKDNNLVFIVSEFTLDQVLNIIEENKYIMDRCEVNGEILYI